MGTTRGFVGQVPQWGHGRAPMGSGTKSPDAGDKYGCILYRDTMKSTKHTNTEISTVIT